MTRQVPAQPQEFGNNKIYTCPQLCSQSTGREVSCACTHSKECTKNYSFLLFWSSQDSCSTNLHFYDTAELIWIFACCIFIVTIWLKLKPCCCLFIMHLCKKSRQENTQIKNNWITKFGLNGERGLNVMYVTWDFFFSFLPNRWWRRRFWDSVWASCACSYKQQTGCEGWEPDEKANCILTPGRWNKRKKKKCQDRQKKRTVKMDKEQQNCHHDE